ncbi:MAG: bifunctional salicylyl-CoA 5-hydroxylase/oxidoreductase [Candidatus Eremiobacteraeota bacterium]|nr:bifunctional salicylyl-CoA 5-hydroxylase/oxidoreductase [Candidatus Eremiobacteraeota bacterium]
MKIVCVGGGPAGLYFSILMKKADPAHEIRVIERNRPYDTFGWGVVFSDQTLGNLQNYDRKTYDDISRSFAHWDNIDVQFGGRTITSGGHGFSGIARKKVLNILQSRAEELGVRLIFECEVSDLASYEDADFIVAADGSNSRIRSSYADHFKPDIETRKCKYVWLGTHKVFDAFTFIFKKTEHGWFTVHAYRFDRDTSTFIVECADETWRKFQLDTADTQRTIAFCEKLFCEYLDGHHLLSNSRHLAGADWINFKRVSNQTWHYGKIVLVGDAAHTAHFSVGSGTKLALEDAIALHDSLQQHSDAEAALRHYEDQRRIEVLRLQSAARNSTEWFENVKRYAALSPEQFAYSLLTRSQRISHENLRLRDKSYVERIETWLSGAEPVPPMFTPFRLRDLTLRNRVAVSPMDMYSAVDGLPTDFHLVHLGSRALGGAGLVYTEMTCVSPEGRITHGCTGMYLPDHLTAWQRITAFMHANSEAKVCMQLGHSGPKGATKLMWEGMDEPLEDGAWEVVGPSAVAYGEQNQTPRELTVPEMQHILEEFVQSTRMAQAAGFDMLELHCAHGYLLSSFITPLQNRRRDRYGGSLANRLRYPLEVFGAMRSVWPAQKPMSVRISATDWLEGGITGEDSVRIARAFKDAGADLIDVSTGQTSRQSRPMYGRMYQTPFSDRIRNEVGIATLAVGNIYEPDHVNSIIAAGRADLCALGRPHLSDPFWTLHAAAQLGYKGQPWPNQYLAGKSQLERNLARAAEMTLAI